MRSKLISALASEPQMASAAGGSHASQPENTNGDSVVEKPSFDFKTIESIWKNGTTNESSHSGDSRGTWYTSLSSFKKRSRRAALFSLWKLVFLKIIVLLRPASTEFAYDFVSRSALPLQESFVGEVLTPKSSQYPEIIRSKLGLGEREPQLTFSRATQAVLSACGSMTSSSNRAHQIPHWK